MDAAPEVRSPEAGPSAASDVRQADEDAPEGSIDSSHAIATEQITNDHSHQQTGQNEPIDSPPTLTTFSGSSIGPATGQNEPITLPFPIRTSSMSGTGNGAASQSGAASSQPHDDPPPDMQHAVAAYETAHTGVSLPEPLSLSEHPAIESSRESTSQRSGRRSVAQTSESGTMRQSQMQGDDGSSVEFALPRWQPDAEVTYCPICHAQFSFFVRKHHCRFVMLLT